MPTACPRDAVGATPVTDCTVLHAMAAEEVTSSADAESSEAAATISAMVSSNNPNLIFSVAYNFSVKLIYHLTMETTSRIAETLAKVRFVNSILRICKRHLNE